MALAENAETAYGQALLEIGIGDGSIEELCGEITALARIFDDNRDFAGLLSSPSVALARKEELIKSVFEGKISAVALNFLCVLAENGRLSLIGGIASELRRGYLEYAKITPVTVITAVPMNDKARERLAEKLKSRYGKVTVTEKIAPEIIGGMIIICQNNMIDGSLRTRLKNIT